MELQIHSEATFSKVIDEFSVAPVIHIAELLLLYVWILYLVWHSIAEYMHREMWFHGIIFKMTDLIGLGPKSYKFRLSQFLRCSSFHWGSCAGQDYYFLGRKSDISIIPHLCSIFSRTCWEWYNCYMLTIVQWLSLLVWTFWSNVSDVCTFDLQSSSLGKKLSGKVEIICTTCWSNKLAIYICVCVC